MYPELEIHGSTQMTVHDSPAPQSFATFGVTRVVLARENTLDDFARIHRAVPELGLESFVHGALCISVFRPVLHVRAHLRAERQSRLVRAIVSQGLCAASTWSRETDSTTATSSRPRISAAHDDLAGLTAAGIGCLKIEGRKKRPEYVATVTQSYRRWLDRLAHGDRS